MSQGHLFHFFYHHRLALVRQASIKPELPSGHPATGVTDNKQYTHRPFRGDGAGHALAASCVLGSDELLVTGAGPGDWYEFGRTAWQCVRRQQRRGAHEGRTGGARSGGGLVRHQPGLAQGSWTAALCAVDQTDPAGQLLQGNRNAGPVPADRIFRELGGGPIRRPALAGLEDRPTRRAQCPHLGDAGAPRARRAAAGPR
jgi:hypothetical protein